MQIILSNISFSVFEMLFIVAIPVLLIIVAIAYLVTSNKQLNIFKNSVQNIIGKIENIDDYSIENVNSLKEAADDVEYSLLKDAINETIENGNNKYQGKWLPDLSEKINKKNLTNKQLKSVLGYTPILFVVAIGFLASIILEILPIVNPIAFSANITYPFFNVIPLIIGILIALFLLNYKNVLENELDTEIDSLKGN